VNAIILKKKILREYKLLFYDLLETNKLTWTAKICYDYDDYWTEFTSNDISGVSFKFKCEDSFSITFWYGVDVMIDGNHIDTINGLFMPFTRLKIRRAYRLKNKKIDCAQRFLKLKEKLNTINNECN
jgi:hypothetical protein